MKITRLTLHHVNMPLREVFVTSSERIDMRACILVEVFGDGVTGYGECVAGIDPGYSYETVQTAWHVLKDFLAPALLYREISLSEFDACMHFVRGHAMAKAGLEMALWDWQGKAQNLSLRKMLGGEREQVPVGVSVGIQSSPAELLKRIEVYLAQGYRRVKFKIKPGRELAETRAVRQAYPDLLLQVDANSAYTLETAESLMALDDYNLLLIEQPLDEDDLWDHRTLQARLRTSICLDESILSARHARQALEMGACRIINIKAGRVGGLGVGKAIHDVCLARKAPVWCGGMLETGVGRAANLALASLPGFTLPGDISATTRYYTEDITEQQFSLNTDSTIDVPDAPGLGITIDPAALRKYSIAKLTLP